jgi:cobalt/nickel transport system permease protein
MSKLEQAVRVIHAVDDAENQNEGGIHPLSRLAVTFFYLFAVLSFGKYDVTGLAGMVLYPLLYGIWHEIPFRRAVWGICPVLFVTVMLGMANLWLDRQIYFSNSYVTISYGMMSMLTLIGKGIFCVLAVYLLLTVTGMRKFCYALHCLHIPKEMVTALLLMYRYLIVLVKEVERMQQAYRLRAPRQKGLHIRTWGAFVGLLLLRSIDRAQEVYESMQLRGFSGEMPNVEWKGSRGRSILYVFVWGMVFLFLRIMPLFQIAGSLLPAF